MRDSIKNTFIIFIIFLIIPLFITSCYYGSGRMIDKTEKVKDIQIKQLKL